MEHLSIRVPWHDNNWNGTVCSCPFENTFCMQLPRIAGEKDVEKEKTVSGKDWSKLSQDQMPSCLAEAGAFMNKNAYKRIFRHVYAYNPKAPHHALLPTEVDVPPYSFFGTPFRYMLVKNQDEINKKYPDMPADETAPFINAWVYGRERQYAIIERFRSKVQKGSLVVFYTKSGNPVDEDTQRLIVGIGEIDEIHKILEYNTSADYTYPLWDQLITHSIRKNLKESRGFLLPYNDYLNLTEEEIKERTGISKDECLSEIELSLDKLGNSLHIMDELSYGCDHVDNHTMLIILNEAKQCIENVIHHKISGGDWRKQLSWIDEQIAKVKDNIGPFPSFPDALSSIGVNYAYIIEQDLRNKGILKVKDNPWPIFEKLVNKGIDANGTIYEKELTYYRQTWNCMNEDERFKLQLLSRIQLSSNQITKARKAYTYEALSNNPYILSENSDINIPESVITTQMIDVAVFSDSSVQGTCLPERPYLVESKIDERRIRSLIIYFLKMALNDGDTLVSLEEVSAYLEDLLESDDKARLPEGYIMNMRSFMEGCIEFVENEKDHKVALQLKEYHSIEKKLSNIFKARAAKSVREPISENWKNLIISSLENYDPNDERMSAATEGQAKALSVLADRKLSVLTGAAGTGKTKVVEAFLRSEKVRNEGVLLLAPTGKARVRLGNIAGMEALTVAQFLTRQGYFDWETMTPYIPENGKKYSQVKNVIVDECSMLTVKDFYVLLQALDLQIVSRIILIGDQYQLPPIGAGRPFADLCVYLENNIPQSLAVLNNVVRTFESHDSDILTLASWFSGKKPTKDADAIFDKLTSGDLHSDLAVYTWKNTEELNSILKDVLDKELPNKELSLPERLSAAMGLDSLEKDGAKPEVVENFQILSPVKGPVWGTYHINDEIQSLLSPNAKKYGIGIGSQFFTQGDKVIQTINKSLKSYPGNKNRQLSNGQIGFVAWKEFTKNNKGKMNVTFSGYPNERFTYYSNTSDDNSNMLELAYAITIHKSQGSDFNTVVVVLPKTGRILSRELVYTALTRAKGRLILFIEDNPSWLRELSDQKYSIVLRRNSNMFSTFAVRDTKSNVPYVENLINKTISGLMVRSKSELTIANELIHQGIEFSYEKELEIGGKKKLPDFTFVDAGGDAIIWEHLGMLNVPSYKCAWERKLDFYEANGYHLGENLFTTEDTEQGGLDSTDIIKTIDEIKEILDL